jgi:hypothetical protein
LKLLWRKQASNRCIFVNILGSILIFTHYCFLALFPEFLLPSFLLLNGFIIFVVILEGSKLVLSKWVQIEVNINAFFVQIDLSEIKFITFVSAVAPYTAQEKRS